MLKPLYDLFKTKQDWKWSNTCEHTFSKVKQTLTLADVLVHYNPELELDQAVDASDYGIGAVISHTFHKSSCEKSIAFASRNLTKSEVNYSQIQKEALAIIYGVTKCYQYLFARKFILITDHTPLVTIFGPKKGIPMLAASKL